MSPSQGHIRFAELPRRPGQGTQSLPGTSPAVKSKATQTEPASHPGQEPAPPSPKLQRTAATAEQQGQKPPITTHHHQQQQQPTAPDSIKVVPPGHHHYAAGPDAAAPWPDFPPTEGWLEEAEARLKVSIERFHGAVPAGCFAARYRLLREEQDRHNFYWRLGPSAYYRRYHLSTYFKTIRCLAAR